jgi:hypothetical protein
MYACCHPECKYFFCEGAIINGKCPLGFKTSDEIEHGETNEREHEK